MTMCTRKKDIRIWKPSHLKAHFEGSPTTRQKSGRRLYQGPGWGCPHSSLQQWPKDSLPQQPKEVLCPPVCLPCIPLKPNNVTPPSGYLNQECNYLEIYFSKTVQINLSGGVELFRLCWVVHMFFSFMADIYVTPWIEKRLTCVTTF